MLSDNIKNLRKANGISQEELAIKLNVVRQTVSKWENGMSVPDSEMLIRIAEELDTSVSVLLDETTKSDDVSDIKVIANKLSIINDRLARYNESRRKIWRTIFIIVFVITTCAVLRCLVRYIYIWAVTNNTNVSTTVIGGYDGPTNIIVSMTVFHLVPLIFIVVLAIASFIGIYKTRKK